MSKRALAALATTALVGGGSLGLLPLPAAQAAVSSSPQAGFPSFNGPVEVIKHRGSTVYVGGDFTRVSDAAGKHRRRHVAAVDLTTMTVTAWNPRTDDTVRAIQWTKKGIFLGGDFTRVQGAKHLHLAKVRKGSGAPIASFKTRVNGPVNAVAARGKKLYLGGDFRRVNGKARSRAAAVGTLAPYRLKAWRPDVQNGPVNDIVVQAGTAYLAGEFRAVAGMGRFERLVKVDTAKGAVDTSFNSRAHRVLHDIVVSGPVVYAAEGGAVGGGVNAYDALSGAGLWSASTGIDGRRFDGDVMALALQGSDLYVGGHFTHICAVSPNDDQDPGTGTCLDSARQERRWGGATLDPATGVTTDWDPMFAGPVEVDALDATGDGRVAAGGAFTQVGMPKQSRLRFGIFG
jgi:hypothetical protein